MTRVPRARSVQQSVGTRFRLAARGAARHAAQPSGEHRTGHATQMEPIYLGVELGVVTRHLPAQYTMPIPILVTKLLPVCADGEGPG